MYYLYSTGLKIKIVSSICTSVYSTGDSFLWTIFSYILTKSNVIGDIISESTKIMTNQQPPSEF